MSEVWGRKALLRLRKLKWMGARGLAGPWALEGGTLPAVLVVAAEHTAVGVTALGALFGPEVAG